MSVQTVYLTVGKYGGGGSTGSRTDLLWVGAEGRRGKSGGQALRLAWTQKSMLPPGGKKGDVTTGAVSRSTGEPGYYIQQLFFRVKTAHISKRLEMITKNAVWQN